MNPPKFFSPDFHLRFFPALLRRRLRHKKTAGTGFGPSLEFPLLFVVCCVLIVAGIPMAVNDKSIVGWVMGGLGALMSMGMFVVDLVLLSGALSL